MFKKKILVAWVMAAGIATTPACSWTDALKLVKPQSGVSLDAQVGAENNKQVVVGDQKKIDVEADEVHGDLNTNTSEIGTEFSGDLKAGSFTVNNMPTKDILLYAAICIFLLGMLFPSPFEMWRGFKNQVAKIRSLR